LANDNDDSANSVFKNETRLVNEITVFVGGAAGTRKIHLKSWPFLGQSDRADDTAPPWLALAE
jgi:hypothetical protein